MGCSHVQPHAVWAVVGVVGSTCAGSNDALVGLLERVIAFYTAVVNDSGFEVEGFEHLN